MTVSRARCASLAALLACGGSGPVALPAAPQAVESGQSEIVELPALAAASLAANEIFTGLSPSVDGELADWPATPTLTFTNPAGTKTDLWLSMEATRVVLAARGDTEKLALLLESSPPWFPPIGFAHQFGEETLASADECPTNEPDEPCVRWFNESVARHDELRRRFSRQLQIDAHNVTIDDEAVASRPRRGNNGVLEIELPLELLPMIAEAPLRSLRLSLRVDEGSPVEPALAVPLERPLGFGPHPEWLSAVINEAGPQLRFYQPSASDTIIKVAFNQRVGYQYTPVELSPFIGEIRLRATRTIATVGSMELVELPRSHDNFGVTLGFAWRAPSGQLTLLPVEEVPPGPPVTAAFVRGSSVDLFFAHQESQNPFGAGLCGSCPMATLSVARATHDGLHQVARALIVPETGEPIQLRTDGSGRFLEASFDCFEKGQRKVRIDYNTASSSYVSSTDEVASCHTQDP